MDDFINICKRDPKIQITIKDMLDKNNRLPYNCQPKMGFDTLIQNVILKKVVFLLGTTIVDIDIELKMKISRIEYLEGKKLI